MADRKDLLNYLHRKVATCKRNLKEAKDDRDYGYLLGRYEVFNEWLMTERKIEEDMKAIRVPSGLTLSNGVNTGTLNLTHGEIKS